MRNSFVIALLVASTQAMRLRDDRDAATIAREGHVDMAFQPNPIFPNTLHESRQQKIPSVKNSNIGESVWRSSIEGGDPHPVSQKRNIIGTPPMFSYPTKQTPDPDAAPSNGIVAEEKVGAVIDPAVIANTSAQRAKEAAADQKEADASAAAAKEAAAPAAPAAPESKSLLQQDGRDAATIAREGHVDMAFQPNPIYPNTLHNKRMKEIPSVKNSHIGESVFKSSIEGGDAVPQTHSVNPFGGANDMWTYPTKQTVKGAPVVQEAAGSKIPPAKVAEAKAKRATEAVVAKEVAEGKKPDPANAPITDAAPEKK